MKLKKIKPSRSEVEKAIHYSLLIALTALIASALTLSFLQPTISTTPSVKTIYKDIIKTIKVPYPILDKHLTEDQIIKLSKKYMHEAGHNLDEYELRPIVMKIGSETNSYKAYFNQRTQQWSVIYKLIEDIDMDPVDSTLQAYPIYPKECFIKIDNSGALVEKIQCLKVE